MLRSNSGAATAALLALCLLSACAQRQAADAPAAAAAAPRCVAVLMGYWPPTNEMLRRFSRSGEQNPQGWVGADWRGLGYDVLAFFPEFPPDGNPMNDPRGSAGRIGSATSDLRVDYQDTSADFWRLVDRFKPRVLITTSRGGRPSAGNWRRWKAAMVPASPPAATRAGLDQRRPRRPPLPQCRQHRPRSAALLRQHRTQRVASRLPLAAITAATTPLALTNVATDQATSGNYLSGFLGLHGIAYGASEPGNVASGHIHVGTTVSVADARALLEASLEATLRAHPAAPGDCGASRPQAPDQPTR